MIDEFEEDEVNEVHGSLIFETPQHKNPDNLRMPARICLGLMELGYEPDFIAKFCHPDPARGERIYQAVANSDNEVVRNFVEKGVPATYAADISPRMLKCPVCRRHITKVPCVTCCERKTYDDEVEDVVPKVGAQWYQLEDDSIVTIQSVGEDVVFVYPCEELPTFANLPISQFLASFTSERPLLTPPRPTDYPPGSWDKRMLMRWRVANGFSPFHEDDAKINLAPRQLETGETFNTVSYLRQLPGDVL